MNIENFNLDELLELFNLDKNLTHQDLSREFIKLLKNNKNINDKQLILLKNAYHKLEKYIDLIEEENSSSDDESIHSENDINILNINKEDNVISKPLNLPESVIQSEYKSSNLNNIKRNIITKNVNIDSIFRNKNYELTNDFIFEFKEDLKNIISYKVTSVEIPNMWYTFSEYLRNNVFYIKVYNYSTGNTDSSGNIIYDTTEYEIKIPEGSYNRIESTNIINNLFINLGGGMLFLLFDINKYNGKTIIRAKNEYDTEYETMPKPFVGNESTNKYYSPNFKFDLIFDFPEYRDIRKTQNDIIEEYSGRIQTLSSDLLNIYNKILRPIEYNCGYIMGFFKDIYNIEKSNTYIDAISESVPIKYDCYVESESYFGESIIKYIFLKIDDFNNNTYTNYICENMKNLNNDNIISKIPIYTGSFSNIFNNNSDFISRERVFFGPININKMRFTLVDKFDRLVDIGKSNYSITLEFKIIYE